MTKIKLILLIIMLISTNNLFSQAKISSKVFFDYRYNSDSEPTNQFELNRVYLTYKNNLSNKLSYKFITDVGRFNTGKDNRLSVYLKNALLAWKTDFGKFIFGLQGMNMFSVQEHNWGYRFIEKSPMDLFKFASSADLGVGYYNKFSNNVNVSFLVTNGTGYKKSENDNYKKFSFQIFYGNPSISEGGFNVGTSLSLESYDFSNLIDTTTENRIVFGGFAGYSNGKFQIGAEYNLLHESGINLTENILSGYTNIKISNLINAFGRVDIYDPNTKNDNDGLTYFVGGLNFNSGKTLNIAPNIKYKNPKFGNSEMIYSINFQFKY